MFLAEFLKVGLDKTFRSDLKIIFLHSTMNGGFIIKCRDIQAVNTSLELKLLAGKEKRPMQPIRPS